MRPTSICLGAACLALLGTLSLARSARADWDDRPGFDFHPQVSAEAPCGVGTPPRGHFPLEISPTSLPQGLKLTVQQDAHRLCYVAGNLAEAPTLRVRQGADFTITLRNEITDPAAISNFVTVAKLDTPNDAVPPVEGYFKVIPGHQHKATGATNLHMHGFAVPPVPPQDEVLKTCADPAVGPANCGRREVTYHYHVPDTMPAGLYWYHPHVHGEVHAQMLMGLSGAIVVEGPDDDARRAAGIRDRVFVIRQSQDVDVKTQVAAAGPAHAAPEVPIGQAEHRARQASGRVDTEHELECATSAAIDEITLNGAKVLEGVPADTDLAQIKLAAGSIQLWRVLNAANDAFLDLALVGEDGKALPITIVARDGAPLTDDAGNRLAPAPTTQSQLVPPAGRIEFLVTAPPAGAKVYFVTHEVDTGCAGDRVPERRLALVTAIPTAVAALSPTPAPAVLPPARPDSYTGLLSRPTDRQRSIVLAEYPRPGKDDLTDFYIMERKPGAEFRPYTMDGPPLITVKAGTTEEWDIENWTRERHAFHIHQVHFRVLSIDGKKLEDPPLLDVVDVPYATPVEGGGHEYDGPAVVPGRVHIKVTFPEELAGDIPFHCHLVDHEDNGMMAVLRVVPAKLGLLDDPAGRDAGGAAWWQHPPICKPAADPAAAAVPRQSLVRPSDNTAPAAKG